jgi:chromosome segregation ATPase
MKDIALLKDLQKSIFQQEWQREELKSKSSLIDRLQLEKTEQLKVSDDKLNTMLNELHQLSQMFHDVNSIICTKVDVLNQRIIVLDGDVSTISAVQTRQRDVMLAEANHLNRELNKVKVAELALKRNVESQYMEAELLRAELVAFNDENDKLKNEVSKDRQENVTLCTQLQMSEFAIQQLQSEMQSLKAQTNDIKNEARNGNEQLLLQISELNAAVESKSVEIDRLNLCNLDKERLIQTLHGKSGEFKENALSKEREIEELKKSNSELTHSHAKTKELLETARQDLRNCVKKLLNAEVSMSAEITQSFQMQKPMESPKSFASTCNIPNKLPQARIDTEAVPKSLVNEQIRVNEQVESLLATPHDPILANQKPVINAAVENASLQVETSKDGGDLELNTNLLDRLAYLDSLTLSLLNSK